METKQFKAESKKLLDMMINSIYTNKDIFLRELISNASDAIDKMYFKALTDTSVGMNKSDFEIMLTADKDARTLTISDNGIGMTAEELEENLGTIAKSGSLDFKTDNELGDDVDIIGQFGVGFYSAFMVASEVVVESKAYGSDIAYRWTSKGVEGYSIEPCDKENAGTTITLKLKENTENDKYDKYLDQYQLQSLVKKYSDYIRFPIKMEMEHREYGEDYENPTITKSVDTLNDMVPIWKKNKFELKDEDYNQFYTNKFMDYNPPLLHIHQHNESGLCAYNALMYIPSKAPFDYYSKDFKKGLALYSSSVMIMEKCEELVPDYFGFVKGVIDSDDLSLNISRELLQQDAGLKTIAKNVEKSIKNELLKLQKNNREKYEEFFKEFGTQLKFGVYQNMGADAKKLEDLLMFVSSKDKKNVTLKEYVERMPEDQKFIYYACGESVEKIDILPALEKIKEKGYEVLYFTANVDEFAVKVLMNYNDKPFKSITDSDLDLETEEEKEQTKKLNEDNKDLLEFMKNAIGEDKISEVKLSSRLKNHAVCLSSSGMLSLEMEKVLNSMPENENKKVSAQKLLEINQNHEIFEKLKSLYISDKDKLTDYTKLLYTQALLIEGLPIENPTDVSSLICKLMTE